MRAAMQSTEGGWDMLRGMRALGFVFSHPVILTGLAGIAALVGTIPVPLCSVALAQRKAG